MVRPDRLPSGDHAPMLELFAELMWRNTKEDLGDEVASRYCMLSYCVTFSRIARTTKEVREDLLVMRRTTITTCERCIPKHSQK